MERQQPAESQNPIGWPNHLIALAVFLVGVLVLCWPMLQGKLLIGPYSDFYEAGYSYRAFAAEYFRQHHSIPQWDPYLLGGIPYVAGMHGDIFYPTAALRWLVGAGTGWNLGFALHFLVAGIATYAFLLKLKVSWPGALIGGLTYQLTGIVASQALAGHDGKLFVSAVTPLLFLAIFVAVRERKLWSYGLLALSVGLALHGHPQTSYYLLIAGLVWGIYLVFVGPEAPRGADRTRVIVAALAAGLVGVGMYAVQVLPVVEYIKYSPRGDAGESRGWEYAVMYSVPIEELMSTVLPQFNGVIETYWGQNPLKFHSEFFGGVALTLAILGIGWNKHRRVQWGLFIVGGLFLLISLGGHTPFYRLWYEVMPMMKRFRAPGMAFFLVSFPLAVLAGMGADRLFSGEASRRRAFITLGVLGGIALLGVAGVLQGVAEGLAIAEHREAVLANASDLRIGSLQLLAAVLVGGGIIVATVMGRLKPLLAAVGLTLVVGLELWGLDRRYFTFAGTTKEIFARDPITTKIGATPLPYRVWDPQGAAQQYGVYPRSWLMAFDIPTLFGYHGQELRFFDELLGGKNAWVNQVNPTIWELFAVRYAVLRGPQNLPGFHQVLGPVTTTQGVEAVLYEADTLPSWARVVPGAAKLPEAQIPPTVIDPKFPASRIVLLPDTVTHAVADLHGKVPDPSPVQATVAKWEPGKMAIELKGRAESEQYLVVSENWYKDWQATVDGKPAPVLRGQHALITVPIAPGAQRVELEFRSPTYQRGRAISTASAGIAVLVILFGALSKRRRDG